MSVAISVPFNVKDTLDGGRLDKYSINALHRQNNIEITFYIDHNGNECVKFNYLNIDLNNASLSYDTLGIFEITTKDMNIIISICFEFIVIKTSTDDFHSRFTIQLKEDVINLNSLLWKILQKKSVDLPEYKDSGLCWFIVGDILFFKTMLDGNFISVYGIENKNYPIICISIDDILNPTTITKRLVNEEPILIIPIKSYIENCKLTMKISTKKVKIKFVETEDRINDDLFTIAILKILKDVL